jgi:hypothetical protein
MDFNFDDKDKPSDEDESFFSDDNAYGSDQGDTAERGEAMPEESNNRVFIIVAAVLGVLILLTIICMGIFAATKILPTMNAARLNDQATREALATEQQEMIQQSLTQTAGAPTATELFPPTYTPAPTKAATKTPVLAATATTVEKGSAETATAVALKTQLAALQLTKIPTATALPKGGFADDVGAPGLIGLAIVLVVIVFLARRLRSG